MADKIKSAVFSMLSDILAQLDRDWGRVLDLYSGTGSIGIEALSRGATWADFVEVNAGVCRLISENLEHTKLADRARVNNRPVKNFLNSPPTAATRKSERAAGGLKRRKGGAYRNQPEDELPVPNAADAVELLLEQTAEVDNATLAKSNNQYDIIFLDPPYADPKIPDTLSQIARSGLIKNGGLVVIGHSPRVVLNESYGGEAQSGPEEIEAGVVLHTLRHRRHGDSAFTIFIAGNPTDYNLNRPSEEADDEELID